MAQRGKKIDNVVRSKEEVRSEEEILPVVSEGHQMSRTVLTLALGWEGISHRKGGERGGGRSETRFFILLLERTLFLRNQVLSGQGIP